MSITQFKESAIRLENIEQSIISTKRQGENSSPKQSEELIQSMDETLSCIAELMNEGYTEYDLFQLAQEAIGVDGDSVSDFFEGPEDESNYCDRR